MQHTNANKSSVIHTPWHSLKDKLIRSLFRISQKDKHLRRLTRRYWPTMRVTIEDIQFDLHPTDNSTERNMYLSRKLEERESLQVLANEILDKKALIFDIGANCGLYSVFLAKTLKQGSEVHAFEPSPTMAARLQQNLTLNSVTDKSTIHQVALAAERGTAVLHIHEKNHGQSSLRSLEKSSTTLSVEQRPLSDYLQEPANFDYFLIKIDVEGREDFVLYPFIATCPEQQLPDALLIEMVLEDQWTDDLRQLLVDRGYTVTFKGDGNELFKLGNKNHAASTQPI